MKHDLTLTEMAALTGIADATLADWCKQGLRSRKRGRNRVIAVADLLRWCASRREQPGSHRERLAGEQADKVALANAQKRTELIWAWQVRDALHDLESHVGAALEAIPRVAGELAGMTDPGEIRARLLRETRGVRASVARHMGQFADAAEKAAQ
jgi:phage terminase Nu1 subunit (DNA packaging protein)